MGKKGGWFSALKKALNSSKTRRALRALRGFVRLKTLIQGQSVKSRATATLRAMQTLACVQSQIRARRLEISYENEASNDRSNRKMLKS